MGTTPSELNQDVASSSKRLLGIVLVAGLIGCAALLQGGQPSAEIAGPKERVDDDASSLARSGGGSWTATQVVSTESTQTSRSPRAGVDSGGNVHVVWEDETDFGGAECTKIAHKTWNATTGTWSTTGIVSSDVVAGAFQPSMMVDANGNVHVAWTYETDHLGSGEDADIFYKAWNATTGTWTPAEVVSTESTDSSMQPAIGVDGNGNVHVAWVDWTFSSPSPDIVYKRRELATGTWTPTEKVSSESTGISQDPVLTVDAAGNVHVAWVDNTNHAGAGPDMDIFYKHLNASTGTWTMTEVVSTESSEYAVNPSIAVSSNGDVHVAWDDSTDYAGSGTDKDIFWKVRTASSGAWAAAVIVSNTSTGMSVVPRLLLDEAGTLHAAWLEEDDIVHAARDGTSGTWEPASIIPVKTASLMQGTPALAIDASGNMHVAWSAASTFGASGTDDDVFYTVKAIPPGAPVLAHVSLAGEFVHLSWTVPTTLPSFKVYRDIQPVISVDGLDPVGITRDTWFVDQPGDNGTFFYAIVGMNWYLDGTPSNSESITFIIQLGTPVLNPISPAIDLDGVIHLFWVAAEGATSYQVYRSSSPITSTAGATLVATLSTTSFVDVVVANGTWYYAIVARNTAGSSPLSNQQQVTVTIPAAGTPVAPGIPEAVVYVMAGALAALAVATFFIGRLTRPPAVREEAGGELPRRDPARAARKGGAVAGP